MYALILDLIPQRGGKTIPLHFIKIFQQKISTLCYPVLDVSCNSKVEKCFGCKGKYYLNEETQSCIKKPTDFKFKFVSHADNMKISKNPTKISARGQGHLSAFTKLLSNTTNYYLIHFRIHELPLKFNENTLDSVCKTN